jgi:hypothetical protein
MPRRFVLTVAILATTISATTSSPSLAEDTPFREWDETINQAQTSGRISAAEAQRLEENLGKLKDEESEKDKHGTVLPIWHQADVERLKNAVARLAPPQTTPTPSTRGSKNRGSRLNDANGSNQDSNSAGRARPAMTTSQRSRNSQAISAPISLVLMDITGVSAEKTKTGSVCVTAWGKSSTNGKAELRLGVRKGNNQSIEAVEIPYAGSPGQTEHYWKESINLSPDPSCVYVTVQGRNKSMTKCLQL